MNGMDLKVRRIRARVKQHELAAVMGIGRPRVAQIEATGDVPQRTAARYLSALTTFDVVGNTTETAA